MILKKSMNKNQEYQNYFFYILILINYLFI